MQWQLDVGLAWDLDSAVRPASRARRPWPSGSPRCGSSPTRSPTGCRSSRAPDRPSSTRRSSSPRPRSSLGADAALVITPYYSRPTQEGLYQWYSTVAAHLPRHADRALQRADPHRRRRRPRDRRPVAPRPRQHRRRQGDHQGLRALLARVPPVRSRHVDVVGHRAAVPAACSRSAGSVSSAPSPTLRPARSPTCTTTGSRATPRRRSPSTTACTRSST